jgi:hypothetical protein
MKMKQYVMSDNFRILKELERLAEKAVGVLKRSKDARSCREADKLRKGLRGILDRKEKKFEERLMKELVGVLGEVAEYANDPQRSCKSEKFKELGDEISDFLAEEGLEKIPKNKKLQMEACL